ncbi:uncharacterized protein F4822DRAFT_441687 [Hypoxylon trugodes]|uniref:uncharacterized protein n=1 Tax=Hypoxylon trugodes TaxID=326681 RepID=UPI00219098BD|nr:uncharacterized protein F4822DRAFT_441687 [Hypoxylon trugodes]KAI1392945.1 hypothetical protein F4822DRAFT_441687 [Hypoxylon trugodes]
MVNPYFDPNYNPYPPHVLLGTGVLFIIIPILSVGLRFYTRWASGTKVGVDDWITIPSMIICILLSITQIIATTTGGLGGHQELIDGQIGHTDQLTAYEKTKYIYELLGTSGLWIVKLSALLFYRRIFSVGVYRTVNNVFIGLTIAWGIAFTFAVAFQCTPVSTLWDRLEPEFGTACIGGPSFYLSLAISDLILDISIFIVPIPHIQQLRMPRRQKVAVIGVFLLGSVVIAIGITRAIIFGWVVAFATVHPLAYFSDITWYTTGVLFWHLVENVVGLLGCCLPTYAPLFKSLLQKRKMTDDSTESSHRGPDKRRRPSLHLEDEAAPALGDNLSHSSSYRISNYK